MKKQKKIEGPIVLCWIAAVVTVIASVTAMIARSGLSDVTQTAREVGSVTSRLDSVSSIRSLVVSFSEQCRIAQQNWIGAADVGLGMLFLLVLVCIALIATLAVQVKANRRLQAQVRKLQQH